MPCSRPQHPLLRRLPILGGILAATLLTASAAAAQSCQGRNLLAEIPPQARQALDAEIAATPYAEGNVWSALHPDGTRLTIAGTMHLADPRQAAQMEVLAPLLDVSEVLLVEASPDTEAELVARISQSPDLAFISSGPSLLEELGPEDWERLKTEFSARGVPGVIAAKFQPWYAMLTLSIPACATQTLRSGGKEGLDRQLIDRAQAQDIPLVALEDLDMLLDSMTRGSRAEQLESLRLALRTDLASPDMVTTMLDSYFAGRHRESWLFWRHVNLGLGAADRAGVETEMARMERELLEERNLDWIGKSLDATRGKTAMIAVGAAHLSGSHGLLNQLAEHGFALTRIDS